ncbi:hypothetical protein [Pendulispora albinea]|uniref:Uncharacterized protein n=1 Tax=Pendulispora albinea TaxID=2741071 RepID=A0ABZ2M0F5_9BACT
MDIPARATRLVRRGVSDRRGVSAVEYVLVVWVILLAGAIGYRLLAEHVGKSADATKRELEGGEGYQASRAAGVQSEPGEGADPGVQTFAGGSPNMAAKPKPPKPGGGGGGSGGCSGSNKRDKDPPGTNAPPKPSASAPAPKPPASVADASKLIDASEGRSFGNGTGHARAHVPKEGQDPALLAESRKKPNGDPYADNTVFRSGRQGEQALRDIMNERADDLANLKPGDPPITGTRRFNETLEGYHSKYGNTAFNVQIQAVDYTIVRLPSGDLHIIHYQPVPILP